MISKDIPYDKQCQRYENEMRIYVEDTFPYSVEDHLVANWGRERSEGLNM